jgi:hypothetical protein
MDEYNMLTYAQYYKMRPSEFKPNDAVAVKIVAVIMAVGYWTAYSGPTDWTDEQVARDGDKLPMPAAVALFPTIAARYTWRA